MYTTGGAERLAWQYCKNLQGEKYEMRCANTVEDGELSAFFKESNIKIFIGSRSKDGGRFGVAKRLLKYVSSYQPKVIHTHLFGADLFGWYFKRKHKDKVIWISTQHNVEFDTSLLRRVIWKLILKKADKIIAVSENVKKYDEDKFKIKNNKLVLLKNGVELDAWLKVPANKFSNKKLRLATVGRLEKQKGHTYLVKALAQLKDRDWQWHIYGQGTLESKLKKQIKKQEIDDRVIWHGVVDGMPKEYKNIDLVVQPSLWEGLSLVAMEAMVAGRVLVGTPWVVEALVKNKKNGLTIENKSVSSLVDTLRYCFENKKDLASMGIEARKHAKENFSLDKNIAKLEKIYQEFL